MKDTNKSKAWGIGDMVDTHIIEEEDKDYQYTLDEDTKKLIADSLKRVKEKEVLFKADSTFDISSFEVNGNEETVAQSYAHLIVRPETREKVLATVNNLKLSPRGISTVKDWVVFEKEAQILMEYLENNPQVNEKTLTEKVLRIAWDYAQEIGMSPRHRECYSMKI